MSERTVAVRLSANVSAYKAAMAEASASTKQFESESGTNLSKVGATMSSVGSKMTAYVTLPMVAAGAGALKLSSDFNTAFAQMQGLAGVPAEEVDALKESVLDLAGETARAPQELAEALYFAASAGLDTAQAMDAVTIAAQASQVGLGTTQDIVGLAASAIASYGAENINAAQATDVLVATIREGRAEPAELASTLGRVLPIASQLGVSFDEVGGAVAYLSNVFGDTNRTVTATQGLLVKLVSPTQQGRDALAEMGTSVEELQSAIDADGLLGALELLKAKGFDTNAQALRALFDDIEGYQAATALLSADQQTLTDIFAATEGSAGALGEAMGSLDGDAQALSQAWVDMQVALIQVGEVIGPLAADIAGGISAIAGAFSELPDAAQLAVVGVAAFVTGLGPMLKLGGMIVSNLAAIRGALIVLRAAMIGHPILALATGIAAVGTAVYFMANDVDHGGAAVDSMADSMIAAGDASLGLAAELLDGSDRADIMVRAMDQAGVTISQVADAALAGGSAWDDMAAKLGAAEVSTSGLTSEADILGLTLAGLPQIAAEAAAAMAARARVDDTAAAAATAAAEATDFLTLAMGPAADHAGNMVEVVGGVGTALEETVDPAVAAAEALKEWEDSITEAADAAVAAYNEQIDAARDWADSVRDAVDSGAQSFLDIAVSAETSAADYTAALQEATTSAQMWEWNLAVVAENISAGTETQKADFVASLAEMGAAGAPMVADLAGSQAELDAMFAAWVANSETTGDGMIGGLDPVAGGMEEKMRHADGLLHQQMLLTKSRAQISARGIGEAIPAGVALGISQGQGALNSTISGMVDQAIAAAKKEAGIESPSRLFAEEVGQPISQGIAEGITEDAERIDAALERAIAAAADKAIEKAQEAVDAARDLFEGFFDGIDGQRAEADMRDAVADAEEGVADATNKAYEAQKKLNEAAQAADYEAMEEAQKDLADAFDDVQKATEQLEDANYKLTKATVDQILVDEQSRDSWIKTAEAAGLSKMEIDGLIDSYLRLAQAKADAAAAEDAIRAEADMADVTRKRFGDYAAMGMITADQLKHLAQFTDNPGLQLSIMRDYMANADRFFGGGRQVGGGVQAGKLYEVGEGNVAEMYVSGGRQYMIPGNDGQVISGTQLAAFTPTPSPPTAAVPHPDPVAWGRQAADAYASRLQHRARAA